MSDPGAEQERCELAYAQACELYEDLARCLSDTIAALRRRAAAGAPLDETEKSLIRDHQKTILMVLGYEQELWRRHGPTHPAGAVLDLDAARAEVARRLARLAERGDS